MKQRAIQRGARANRSRENLEAPMSAARLAKLLNDGAAKPIRAAVIRSHIAAGAPTDKRRRIRLADYAAWLIRQLAEDAKEGSMQPGTDA